MQRREFARVAAAAFVHLAVLGMGSSLAAAQSWPEKPVKIVSVNPPGGGNDLTARILAKALEPLLGQPVLVDNKPGASGQIASQAVASSAPDGYTLLLAAATHGTNPSLYPRLPYDTLNDFAPVGMAARMPIYLIVSPDLPVKSVDALVSYAKANPARLSFGSAGNGTAPHLALELFKQKHGLDIAHIPFKGSAPAMTSILGGHTQGGFETFNVFAPHAKAGKVRVLAVATPERTPQAPEVPTLMELGSGGFEAFAWFALLAPAGTPQAVLTRLNTELNKILAQPDVEEQYRTMGLISGGGSPEELGVFIRDDIAKWAEVIKKGAISID
jgi:tripartite-type tricarboxylate transporter receptor subunit TctC